MKKRYWVVLISMILVSAVLNLLAWNSTEFSDWYVTYIFPIWINTYGKLTSLFPFSVGELMIAIGLVLVALALVFGIVAVIFLFRHKSCRFFKKFYSCFAYILVIAALLMSLNCFPLYHCSTFEEKYMSTSDSEYSFAELASLRDYIVTRANRLANQMERDENGNVIYSGNIEDAAVASMQNLGTEYEQLSGFYVTPKRLSTSHFMCQQNMRGYYFPFSMEANYNGVMTTMNLPSTMCHELAHTKGFIYEDEANLIGFLACINSKDPMFQYSGYLSVLNYIDNDFYKATGKNKYIYNSHVKISKTVKNDNKFITEETKNTVEKKAVIKTATVKKAASEFIDTNLVANGIPEGALSYEKVVGLLMTYYDGNYDEFPGNEVPGEEYLLASGGN